MFLVCIAGSYSNGILFGGCLGPELDGTLVRGFDSSLPLQDVTSRAYSMALKRS